MKLKISQIDSLLKESALSYAKFKNISIQAGGSDGYFHKFLNGSIKSDSKYSSFIFSSGLKFNKQDIKIDLEGKNSECEIKSALFLNEEDHQEIKTLVNHLVPNCKSFQKIKSVLNHVLYCRKIDLDAAILLVFL